MTSGCPSDTSGFSVWPPEPGGHIFLLFHVPIPWGFVMVVPGGSLARQVA